MEQVLHKRAFDSQPYIQCMLKNQITSPLPRYQNIQSSHSSETSIGQLYNDLSTKQVFSLHWTFISFIYILLPNSHSGCQVCAHPDTQTHKQITEENRRCFVRLWSVTLLLLHEPNHLCCVPIRLLTLHPKSRSYFSEEKVHSVTEE